MLKKFTYRFIHDILITSGYWTLPSIYKHIIKLSILIKFVL